jgi:tetratricopeptide (TPR) repeat protein
MFTMITLSLYLQDQKTMRDLAEESRQPGPPARLRCALADALREAQLFPEAREQISLAMTEAGAAPSAMLSAASIAQDDGCTPEALDYLRRAMILGLPGDELSLAFDHGSLLAALGRHEEAARVWLAIPGARNALGYAYHHVMAATELLHAGKKDEARALFNTVLAMDGELAWPKLIARLFLGQAGEADLQAWVNQTVSPFSKADRTCEFQYFMGTAHELAGKTDAATAAYRACLATRASQNVEFGLARAAQRRLNMPGK